MIYYTDGKLDETNPQLANAVRKRLKMISGLIPIISVSQKPLNFGQNVCVGEKKYCYQSMYEQLLSGLKAVPDNAVVYPVEHDVFYHPSHFAKLPEDNEHCFINTNRYYWKAGLPYFFKARGEKTMSHVVCYRDVLIDHCEKRIAQWNAGDSAANTIDIKYKTFMSERPNVDIRHGGNLTPDGHWKREYFKGQRKGVYNLDGWGSPGHFAKKTGYGKQQMLEAPVTEVPEVKVQIEDPVRWITKRFKLVNQVSPIRIPGWRRDRISVLMNQCGYRNGAEVGVREGDHSKILCQNIPGLNLLCVDRWDAYPGHSDLDRLPEAIMFLDEAKEKLKEYNVTFVRANSMDAVRDIPDESLDFVYIDANHTFDYVMQDIIEWAKKVRKGGMISGHDYFRCRNFGVVDAVDIYCRQHLVREYFITDEKKASFFWIKD